MAEKYPNNVCFIFYNTSNLEITYSELKRRVYLLARNFAKLNLKKGERIALFLPNAVELLIAQFAASFLGLINVPFSPCEPIEEYEYMMHKTSPSALIIFDRDEYKPIVDKLLPEIKDPNANEFKSKKFESIRQVIFVAAENSDDARKTLTDEINPKTVRFYEEISAKLINNEPIEFPLIDSEQIFAILFTV